MRLEHLSYDVPSVVGGSFYPDLYPWKRAAG
jgi:hypothetical protein